MCHQQPISHLPVWVLERRGITGTELRRVRARAGSDGAGVAAGGASAARPPRHRYCRPAQRPKAMSL